MRSIRERLMSEDITITGFNVGTNDGVTAGHTVMHCHLHLIPRREGDMPDTWAIDVWGYYNNWI